jgi:RNA polymerase sigma-70 factor (ECF subfamily)
MRCTFFHLFSLPSIIAEQHDVFSIRRAAVTDERSGNLVARWRQGDQRAADELFRRYTDRLVLLARSRLPGKLAQRTAPEDVVQSVYRVFFSRAREGRYDLERGGDLWRLLVTMTLHKVYQQVRRHGAKKRAVQAEVNFSSEDSLAGLQAHLAHRPSPSEVVALTDQLEEIMKPLPPLHRHILELRLQGHNLDEIADAVDRTERTVRRVLEEIKQQLQKGLMPNA